MSNFLISNGRLEVISSKKEFSQFSPSEHLQHKNSLLINHFIKVQITLQPLHN